MSIYNAVKARTVLLLLASGVLSANALVAQTTRIVTRSQEVGPKRTTLAIRYREGDSTSVNMVGTAIAPQASGKAEIKRKEGRTRVKLAMRDLASPQALGAYYTTYVLWAIAPEGQADNVAEMPFRSDSDIEVTTPLQTFGLIITAEPYSAVKLPSPVIVAENTLRRGTEGAIQTSRIDYRGDPGTLYVVNTGGARDFNADYNTPLIVLGARRAVEIARRAGAGQFAEPELREAEIKLAVLEQTWPESRKVEQKFGGVAREVQHLAEHARELAEARSAEARLAAERQAARSSIAEARNEADRARDEAEAYRDAMNRAQREAALARQRVAEAQTDADKARANEELARAQAEQSRLEAQQAKQDREAAEQRLYMSLSEILETRREARGLVVSLSDVLFDFNKASLKPGAREKLSKLAGILLAYPGAYLMSIEGHTDAIGSDEYNIKLSQDRAESVRYYLEQSGIPPARIASVRGFGKTMPVATNSTAEGRQMNRRVEIVISDTSPAVTPK
jgi:outer membrane protein OmpA-like peptidoglycan-associated protein